MAAVEVTITGTLYDKLARTTQQVVLIGEASLTGLGIGGGPIIPPGQPQPPGIWGPTDPRPTPPIYLPPQGGGQPPGIWGPPGPWPSPPIQLPPGSEQPPHPAHPIVTPPNEGTKPPEPVQPPIEWKAVWHPEQGWIVVGVPNVPHPAPSA